MNLKKELSGVAKVAAQIMGEQLKGQQHKIDANKNNKIDAHDFKLLRAKKEVKKEEVEELDEASYSAKAASAGKDIGKPGKMFGKIAASAAKRYGSEERGKAVAGAVLKKLRMKEDVDHEITDEETEEILNAYDESPKTFSEMLKAYKEEGVAFFAEEPDNEQFTKELEDQKASMQGKKKQPAVAAAATQGVKTMPEEIQVIDANKINGVDEVTIGERTLTEPEMKKKEEIVKSMKKGIAGFKQRYGERAKEVMYATATKRAMGEEVEQIEEGTPEGYQQRDGKLIPKIHPKMTPHEHGYDYTMQTIEDAQSKAEIHRHHKEIQGDNPHPKGSQEHKDWTAGTNKAKADYLKDWS